MINNRSLLMLVSLFFISAPLMAAKPKNGKRSVTPPGLSTKPDAQDKKKAEESSAAQPAEKPANLAGAATPQASTTPVALASSTDQSQKTISLQTIIDRRKWGITSLIIPEAVRKGYHGSPALVMDALENLTPEDVKAFKETNFEPLEDQNLIGRAIEHLKGADDTEMMTKLLVLLTSKQVYAGPAHSKTIVDMLARKQKDAHSSFEQEYAKQCKALIDLTRNHIEESNKLSNLIDQAHKLGGKYNYTDTELRMKQGQYEGSTVEINALREKERKRKALGIVDNHSIHPKYVDPQSIIAVKSNGLYTPELGAQSIIPPAAAK